MIIGSGDSYRISGGQLTADSIQNGGIFESTGGTISTNKIVGAIDFKNSTGTIRGEGLVDLRNAAILNNSSAHLIVDADSLVLLPSANTFASTTGLGSLSPHVVGSTLQVTAGGFRVNGELLDHAVISNGGYAGNRGPGILAFKKGVTVSSTSSSPITGSLSGGASGIFDSIALYADGPNYVGLKVESGATLRAQGTVLLANADAKIQVNGNLEIGGELGGPAINKLDVRIAAVGNASRFSLSSSATLKLNVDRSATLPGQPMVSDLISVTNGLTSIAGVLQIDELSGFQANPKETVSLVATSASSLTGIFSSVLVEDGDPTTSGILTNTVGGGEAAYAVTYTISGVSARISLPGDFNLDDVVNTADQAIWGANVGLNVATWADGDANGDGWVDGNDLMIYQRNFGRSWPALQIVPEPRSVALLMFAFLTFTTTRGRGWHWISIQCGAAARS